MTFDDPALVERIQASLELVHLGLVVSAGWSGYRRISFSADDMVATLFSAKLFTSAFDLAWDETLARKVLKMRLAFAEKVGIFGALRASLPDVFCSKRPALHRARWKELWKEKPASVAGLEEATAKLMEQAFWALAAEPSCTAPGSEPAADMLSESGEPRKCKSKARKARKAPAQKDDTAKISSAFPPEVLDDDCSTCSGFSALSSWPSPPGALANTKTVQIDQVCYVWAESGQWIPRAESAPRNTSDVHVVVKNTFIDLDEGIDGEGPSSCRARSWSPPRSCIGEALTSDLQN